MVELPEHLAEYRKFLVAAEQKAQEDFDKTVLSLSGGALGISFVFLKDVIGSQPIRLDGALLGAWLCWGLSTLSVLSSFFLSHRALREAIRQVDDGSIAATTTPGGWYSFATLTLNVLGALLFFAGVCAMTVFAGANISARGLSNVATQSPAATAPSAAAPSAAASSPASASSAHTRP